jgi:hypothetical protein
MHLGRLARLVRVQVDEDREHVSMALGSSHRVPSMAQGVIPGTPAAKGVEMVRT